MLAVVTGLLESLYFDLAAGGAIIISAIVMFFIVAIFKKQIGYV
jgi:ABC-type Mn2+/Zn2+ transport system permease subunit